MLTMKLRQIVRRRFAPSEALNENPSLSSSVDGLDEAMKDEGLNRDGLIFLWGPNEKRSEFSKGRDPSLSPSPESTSKMQDTLPMMIDSPECDSGLPGLNDHAREVIYDGILQPLLDRQLLVACNTRLQTKEIICLRDLEEVLLLDTCVSVFFSNLI
jgi:hypothetical protein